MNLPNDHDGIPLDFQLSIGIPGFFERSLSDIIERLKALPPVKCLVHKPSPYMEIGFVWAPYIPVLKEPPKEWSADFKPKSKIMMRYAKNPVYTDFFDTITFPALKHVIPGTIKGLFEPHSNLCAEILLDSSGVLPMNSYAAPPAIIADPSRYPHSCPRCSAPAYIGFASVDCSRKSCS